MAIDNVRQQELLSNLNILRTAFKSDFCNASGHTDLMSYPEEGHLEAYTHAFEYNLEKNLAKWKILRARETQSQRGGV